MGNAITVPEIILLRLCRSQETDRLQQVLANPQFRADPFAAIASHLAATMPPVPAQPRSGKKGGKKNGSQKSGLNAKKVGKGGGADAMEQ